MTRLLTLPRRVAATIIRKLNQERRVAVVRGRNGAVTVRSLERYTRHRERMREAIRKTRPWEARRKDPLWPIGSKPLGRTGTLRRVEIYDDR